jgi:DNA-binding transcriptional LysR family regulator
MSQPAVGNALNRLRATLGDDLFLRTSKGIAPTRFAENMRWPVAHALEMILDAVNTHSCFEPAVSKRDFRVALTGVGEIYFLPALLPLLSKVGPGITITSMRNTSVNLRDEMESGKIDWRQGCCPIRTSASSSDGCFRRTMCLFRKANPLDGKLTTLASFQAAEQVSVTPEGAGRAGLKACSSG